jgi:predicted enzyme related to lactoylglutathione lyase
MKEMGPHQPVINTIGVEDIDATLSRIANAGGTIMKSKKGHSGSWLAGILYRS